MKKIYQNIITSIALCFALTNTDAQFVTIPDANFRTWLNTHGYASCMNGNQMDTTCSAVVNATSVSCNNASITNLTGISYDSLKTLSCYSNQLTALPSLPASLTDLSCSSNQLTTLPTLPASLTNLSCSSNQLTTLPALPASLRNLTCYNNQLSTLPPLPALLTRLYCYVNPLTTLPNLPTSLTFLYCGSNQLTSLPTLPASLEQFYCDHNQLTALPTLPATLTYLGCYNNQLTSLPSLPASLIDIRCSSNQLTTLPNLPASLTSLDCYNNQLTALPTLPSSLMYLDCNSNQLTFLPALRDTMDQLSIYNNAALSCLPPIHRINGTFFWGNTSINCLPNSISAGTASPTIAGVPICTPPAAAITASGSTTFNIGDSVTLSATIGTGWSYQWKLNTVNIAGATLSTYKARTTGNYACAVSNGCGYATTNTIAVTVISSNAITIPDPNFIAWLNANGFASCMNGNQMDTTCNAVVNATTVDCRSSNISNLIGISYFDHLTTLYCHSNQLTFLPPLPSTLTVIYCYSNHLTSLPTLPVSLTLLGCQNNQLTTLPFIPSTLQHLYCTSNQLSSLPNLPASLTDLMCANNQLTSLPALRDTLTSLYINDNPGLKCLPPIHKVSFFNWGNAGITCLPNAMSVSYANPSISGVPVCASPAQPASITGNIAVCAGSSQTYSVASDTNAIGYTWSLPSGWVGTSTTNSINVTAGSAGGSISVTANGKCVASNAATSLAVTINAQQSAPTSITVSGGSAKVCPGDTRTYTTPLVAGVTYSWTVPTGAVINSGQGTRTINVTYNSGFTSNGTLSVVKVQGCGVSSPKTLAVNRNVPSTPSAISGTTYGLCGAINKVYSIIQVAGMTYQWTVPATATIVNGQGTNSITVNFPSTNFTGTISVNAVNACGAGTARNLTVRAIPSTPVSITGPITACANQLNVAYNTAAIATATSYIWGVPLGSIITLGQGTNSIVMNYGTASGTVKVRAGNGCGAGSYKNLAVLINCREGFETAAEGSGQLAVVIYPNPSATMFTVKFNSSDDEIFSLTVRDIIGKVVETYINIDTQQSFDFGAQLNNGIYITEILTGSERKIFRIVKSE